VNEERTDKYITIKLQRSVYNIPEVNIKSE
jgi:hypothetical protein